MHLSVIGLGVTEHARLSLAAKQALLNAQWVIGSQRQLATLPQNLINLQAHQKILPPLKQLAYWLATTQVKRIVILASGDPLYYGIGRWLHKNYPKAVVHCYPAISSIQAACHALGLSLQDVKVISLHGRPLLTLQRYLAHQRYLLLLTDQHSHPHAIAQLCQQAGFSQSRLWLCEQLGYSNQCIRQFSISELAHDHQRNLLPNGVQLNIIVLDLIGKSTYLPSYTGINDNHFITNKSTGKGMLTKREVRTTVLSLLQPHYSDIAWDIGAGCGSISIEWALSYPSIQLYAIEHHLERLDCLRKNQHRFGVVDNLYIVPHHAPSCLSKLPSPNKIFIGGSDGELLTLLKISWSRLDSDGILVVSAVTETSKQICLQWANHLPITAIETLQVAISKGSQLANQWVYRPSLPVTLFKFTKALS